MKMHLFYGRTIACLSLLGLVLVLGACAKGPGADATPDQLPALKTPANGQGSTSSSGQGSSTSNGQGSSTSNGQGGASTIIYKGVNITIVSIDQQKQFSDDTQSSGPLLLRINIHEQNPTADTIYVTYNQTMRLILPDGKSLEPVTEAPASIDRDIVRNSWLDFSVDGKQDVNKLILRVGTTSEHQMDVPLTSNPNLTKYQPKSITPNSKLHYGVDWTITTVTSSLNADGEQADAGKRYIIVTLKVDNATENAFYPSISDNFRLKSNTVTQAPKSTTLPGNFAPHSSGTTGTITFSMPENDTDLQLQFLAQPTEKIDAVSAKFRI
ncbi:MAG: hypothetical protein NVSMB44_42520 [Ktedonobacteraceae bacterium]